MLHRTIGVVALGAALGLAPAVFAASTRTHVSNAGSDANTAFSCDYAHPCRTFAAALTVTTAGGEILAIDSSGYGKVTIDRSVSIIAAPGVFAGIGVGSGNGVTIATAGVDVVLRGLTVTGQGGADGINMTAGTSLSVENCVIRNMTANGLSVATGGKIRVLDSTFSNNGAAGVRLQGSVRGTLSGTRIFGGTRGIELSATSGEAASVLLENAAVSESLQTGVTVAATGTGVARLAARNVSVSRSGWEGILAWGEGGTAEIEAVNTVAFDNAFQGFYAIGTSGGTTRMDLRDSVSKRNSMGINVQSSTSATANASVSNTLLADNTTSGLRVYGVGATLSASGNVVMRNGTGMTQGSNGVFYSAGNNQLEGNSTQTTGTISPSSMY